MKLLSHAAAALLLSSPLFIVCSCNDAASELTASGLDPKAFEMSLNGKTTHLYTLTNANGMEVCFTNIGARIVSIMVPDRDGNLQDVVCGFDNVEAFANLDGATPSDFGASIGRYANRIKNGQFSLDGTDYQLPLNNNGHTLHGGPTGWQYCYYDCEAVGENTLTFTIVSPDGDNDFPGNVTASCTYTLTDDNRIIIEYNATTDKATVINMTNHSYFNLSGDPSKPATDEVMWISSTQTTPVDSLLIPTGEIADIPAGSPFDFCTAPKPISQDIEADNEQLRYGMGYDHNWILNTGGDLEKPCASLYSPVSGIKLTVSTTEPGIQVYTGNFQDGTTVGKKGIHYPKRCAVCLETQHYPDSPNHPEWPSTTLRPDTPYQSQTIFTFTVE